MKATLIIFLVYLFTINCVDAEVDIKSLEEKFNKNSNDKLNILNEISTYYFIKDDLDKINQYANLTIEFAKNANNKQLEVDALNQISFIYSYKDKTLSSEYGNRALELANSINYQDGIAYAFFNVAYSLKNAELTKKIEYYLKSLQTAKNINNKFIMAITNTYLGEVYSNIDNYSEAIKYLISAQRLYDKIILTDSTLRTRYLYGEMLNSLGITYKKMVNYDNAERYYNLYKENSVNISNSYGEAIALNNLGIIYYKLKDYQKSISYFLQAKEVFETNGIENYTGTILNNLANIYFDLNEFDKVESNYNLALQFSKQKEDSIMQARILANWADLRIYQEKYNEAKNMLYESLNLVGNQSNDITLNCFWGLSIVYDSLKQTNLSYKYFRMFSHLKDSVSAITKADEIGMITENYNYEKIIEEQKRIAEINQLAEIKNQQRKNNLQYIGISIFLMLFFAFIIFVGKYKLSVTKIESVIFVALLFLFQFISILIEPFINNLTNNEPIFNLLFYALIALVLTPIDTYTEKVLRKKVVLETNKT